MAIPGLQPQFEVRAKVRIGEKRPGEKFPRSLDYFLCPDADFQRVAGEQPKELTIQLPHAAPEANFSTGLEQWAGKMLVCYAKGETVNGRPVAWRKKTMKKDGRDVDLLAGFDVIGREMGEGRVGVGCAVRDCPLMRSKDCKPMGRLQFFLPGVDPAKGVYQLDTKSWHTIEKIEALLSILGDPRGRLLTLRVEMWNRGRDRFPVVTLEAPDVEVNSLADADRADLYVQLRGAVERGDETAVKIALAAVLDVERPGWRDRQDFIDRIKEVGATAAANTMLKAVEL